MFEQLLDRAISAAVTKLLDHAVKVVKQELLDQGHKLTGSLIDTIRAEVEIKRKMILGLVWMNEYFPYLEFPLPPEKVPYSPGSGAKSSKVVAALEKYWRRRGLAPGEARRASFATLNKWKQEGRPTRASFRFSKNGRRTGFLTASIAEIEASADLVLGLDAAEGISRALTIAIRSSLRGNTAF